MAGPVASPETLRQRWVYALIAVQVAAEELVRGSQGLQPYLRERLAEAVEAATEAETAWLRGEAGAGQGVPRGGLVGPG